MGGALMVTVCQLDADGARFEEEWQAIADEVKRAKTDLLVLPEIPFCASFVRKARFEREAWKSALDSHDRGQARLGELGAAAVVATRAMEFGAYRYEEPFVWTAAAGRRSVHTRTRFQDQARAW